ncbi:MAG: site-specific integrase [Pseudomonadota bacterium]
MKTFDIPVYVSVYCTTNLRQGPYMATFRKRGNTWNVEVRRKGAYDSATFDTKSEARDWAREVEASLKPGGATLFTLSDALEKYSAEESPKKKGARWEQIRLKMFQRFPMASIRLSELDSDALAKFRNDRLKSVQSSSVARELTLLSAVLTTARREWKWISSNPLADVKWPKSNAPRNRRISDDEIERIIAALGFTGTVSNKTQEVAVLFLLAIETAARLGELCSISPDDLHLEERFMRLRDTKNGDTRDVPLTREAVRLFQLLPDKSFTISSGSASTLFRKARDTVEIKDLTFHDSRHEACTRLARKIDVLDLAKMIGHKNPKQLLTYYNPTATEIAHRLD